MAARTAVRKQAEIFNNFAGIKHARIFELIKPLGSPENSIPSSIQKLMSAPIIGKNKDVLGVVQISRKGTGSQGIADFTREDLRDLELATDILASSPLLLERGK
ncbi:MAG TPA: hypothetical protein VND65_02035 [Candidatus Binatia bacterium]|nr:hypothetical protein [Candidatus Binatia bacterium]